MGPKRGTSSTCSRLARYRFESAAALGLAALVALLVLAVPASEQERPQTEPRTPAPLRGPTSTAVPRQTGPTPVPVYQPPRATREGAIRHVQALPDNRVPGRTIGDALTGTWTAEYRGDGTWMVRNGEAAWLYLEDSNAAMPANVAAINAQGAGGRRGAR